MSTHIDYEEKLVQDSLDLNIDYEQLQENLNAPTANYQQQLGEVIEDIYAQLAQAEKEYEEFQAQCNHIGVYLGVNGIRATDNIVCRCLLCSKKLNYKEMESFNGRYIHARNYLSHLYPNEYDPEYTAKFEIIKMLANEIFKLYPEMSTEAFIDDFNARIQASIAIDRNLEDRGKQKIK